MASREAIEESELQILSQKVHWAAEYGGYNGESTIRKILNQ